MVKFILAMACWVVLVATKACRLRLRAHRRDATKSVDPTVVPHQLEILHQVVKHRGISAASRNMPYGLGQPAISGQMAALEGALGVALFTRKPFKLSPQGEMLAAHVGPFFDGLGPLFRRIRGEAAHSACIAVDDMIAPAFFPGIIAAAAPHSANTSFEFQTGIPVGLEEWLRERRVDLVITAARRRIRGFESHDLARPGLRLLVWRKGKIASPGHFWRQKRIAEPLIWPLVAGPVHEIFERNLRSMGVDWPFGFRVASTADMLRLVAGGHGVGISLELPANSHGRKIREIPLTAFGSVPMKVFWRPQAGPWVAPAVAAIKDIARALWSTDLVPAAA